MSVNHLFSAFSFISFVIVSIPIAWHLKASNTATCFYMFWVSISSLTSFINSVIWDENIGNWAPVWCDISGRIILAASFAFPAACLCIQRRLYRIILNPFVDTTRAERRRLIVVDVSLCLGMPILNIILAYIVQTQRYAILGDIGCYIPTIPTALAVVFVPGWKLLIGVIGGIYAYLNVYHLWIKRRTIKSILGHSTGGLSFSHYLKLMMLSGMDPLLTIPFNAWVLTTWIPLYPDFNWTTIHADFSRVYMFPTALWRLSHVSLISQELYRWNSVIYAFTFFFFFGMTGEARRHYKLALKFVAKKVGFQAGSSGSTGLRLSKHVSVQPSIVMCSRDIGSATLENQHPTLGKSDPPRYIDGEFESRSAISMPFINFDLKSKQELPAVSESSPSLDLIHSLSPRPQVHVPCIQPPPASLDLTSICERLPQRLASKTAMNEFVV